MSGERDVARYYDAFSASYEGRRGRGYHRFLDDMQAELVLAEVRGSDSVLELGCGTGLLMERVRPHVRELVGVDLSEGMLARAKARGLEVACGSMQALPFPDESFDVVYSFKVLPHVERIDAALAEARRVLRPDGVALLEFYNPWSLRGLRKRMLAGRTGEGQSERDVYTRRDDLDAARILVERAGLVPVGQRGLMVLTPLAVAHDVPGVGALLRTLERGCCRTLARWAGFLTVIARRA